MILPPPSRGDLTNQQWQRLKPLLPAQKPEVGRPSNDHCTIINGILWIVRTGAPWRDLPERYGAWETVSGRFYRWRIHWAVVKDFTEAPTTSRCRRQARLGGALRRWQCDPCSPTCSRGKKGEVDADSGVSALKQVQEREALGRSKGGFSTKIHLRARWQWLACYLPNYCGRTA